jgi:hypothetical protein
MSWPCLPSLRPPYLHDIMDLMSASALTGTERMAACLHQQKIGAPELPRGLSQRLDLTCPDEWPEQGVFVS